MIHPQFRLEQRGALEIYYAPLDYLRPAARLVVVGITPGKGTVQIAYQTAVDGLARGRPAARVLDDVKSRASFSGFRQQLASWLDWLRIPRHLHLRSSMELWSDARKFLHPTSAVRYPVLIRGRNYAGTSPGLTQDALLRRYLYEVLAPELARVPDALVVPLGVRVDEAILLLADSGHLDSARCLVGFPHPSGANGHKGRQWEANRDALRRKVWSWFRSHPVG